MDPVTPVPHDPRVFVVAPLGLGDMFVLRGLLTELAQTKTLAFAVKAAYAAHAARVLGDLVQVVPVDGGDNPEPADLVAALMAYKAGFRDTHGLLPLGGNFADFSLAWHGLHECWAHRLYIQCGLDPGLRYSAFGAPPGLATAADASKALAARVRELAGGRPYVLVHDDAARPLDVSRLPPDLARVHVDDVWAPDLFEYVDAIRGAAEFHGIDSCFMHLVDHLDLPVKAVCHAYARGPVSGSLYRRARILD